MNQGLTKWRLAERRGIGEGQEWERWLRAVLTPGVGRLLTPGGDSVLMPVEGFTGLLKEGGLRGVLKNFGVGFLCISILLPSSLGARERPGLAVPATTTSGGVSLERLSRLRGLLHEAFSGLNHYAVFSLEEGSEVSGPAPDFLALSAVEGEDGHRVIRLSVVRASDRRVMSESVQPLFEDLERLKRSVGVLVEKVHRGVFLPEQAGVGGPGAVPRLSTPPPDPGAPFYSTWWFWTAVGAVGVIGTLAYIKKGPEGLPAPLGGN